MTWQALEHERQRYAATADQRSAEDEGRMMSRGWLVKAQFPQMDGHNISWFWVSIGNCTSCRFFRPADAPDGPGCMNPNAAIREHFWEYLNQNVCPGFVAGQSPDMVSAFGNAELFLDAMRATGLADGEPSQPVEILQRVRWSPWASHQARAQQEHFLAMARSHDFGQDERMHRQDIGDIES